MVSIDTLAFLGQGLSRPECVLAHQTGLLFAPCWHGQGGISIITPSGETTHLLAAEPPEPVRPNGIALEAGGSFLLAHLGAERGGIYRLFADGRCELVVGTIDGAPLPPANFVTTDSQGRIWFTVSTRITPRAMDYRSSANTGFIGLIENGVAKIVADQIGYANEIAFSADERTLWVNETFARRTTAFDVSDKGELSKRRTVATHGEGTFPDGLTPDAEGGLWITSIISNRVIRLTPTGDIITVMEDSDPEHLSHAEAAFQSDSLGRAHLDTAVSEKLKNISNLAFGGPDLRTAYLGCLLGDEIAFFESRVAGLPLPHWDAKLGPLAQFIE